MCGLMRIKGYWGKGYRGNRVLNEQIDNKRLTTAIVKWLPISYSILGQERPTTPTSEMVWCGVENSQAYNRHFVLGINSYDMCKTTMIFNFVTINYHGYSNNHYLT